LHNTIETTLRAEKLDQWQCGADVINELITLGANPSKLDDKGRSALAVMKEYPLVPDDLRNGKEDIVSFSFLFFFFFFFVLHAVRTNVRTRGLQKNCTLQASSLPTHSVCRVGDVSHSSYRRSHSQPQSSCMGAIVYT
jgi:hypothetical protein